MIVQTTRISREGGVHYLARHLLDKVDENERIDILAGDRAALYDAHSLAKVKSCRYSIRHLSISPEREMSPAQLSEFLRAVDVEFCVGPDRPRLVVRHIKKGRSHFHVAVAEVDPATLRVLDCKNDFRRLEDLARRYEADHAETVQPTRIERWAAKSEGFSDVARKRAERSIPGFDRSRLRAAFAKGIGAFQAELKTQGLQVADGEKGPILIAASGMFVAAAHRAAGVRQNEFLQFMERIDNEQLIGSPTPALGTAGLGSTHHYEAPAALESTGDTRRARSNRTVSRNSVLSARSPATTGAGSQDPARPGRSPVPAITGRYHERLFLHRITKLDLDDLLHRAQELASWIMSAFEPEARRITRQIAAARKKRNLFPSAAPISRQIPTYDQRRRIMP